MIGNDQDGQKQFNNYKTKDQNIVPQHKRHLFAMYFFGIQLAEVFILYNIFDLFFQCYIISPLIQLFFFFCKKFLQIMHYYIQNQNNKQSKLSFCFGDFFGSVAQTLTYGSFEQLVGISVPLLNSCILQIIHVYYYQDDKISNLIVYFLGTFSMIALTQNLLYLEYKKDYLLILRSIETATSFFILQISFFKFLSFSWTVIFLYVLVSVGIGYYLKIHFKANIFAYYFSVLILGIQELKIRDNNASRKYQIKTINKDNLGFFIVLLHIIVISVIDIIFYDQNNLTQINMIYKILMVIFIPTSITLVSDFQQFIKHKTHISDITIESKDFQDIQIEQMLEKFFTFKEHETEIRFQIIDTDYEVIQPLITKIFSEYNRHYFVKYIKNNVQSLITLQKIEEEQQITIISKDLQFIEMTLNSLSNSECYKYQPYLVFRSDSQTPFDIQFINSLFLRHYQLSNSNLKYIQGDLTQCPFKEQNIYKQVKCQLVAFNKNILNELSINPNQVMYDLYEDLQ